MNEEEKTRFLAPGVKELLQRSGLSTAELGGDLGEGDQFYVDALYLLTRMHFGPDDAKNYWSEILRHLDGLNRTLKRDVGIRVAVCDYFMNLHPKLRDPVLVEVQVLLQKEKGALVDELTGLYNRRYFNDAIVREVERFKRFGQHFSLVMLDVDHFKRFNDAHGHLAGDAGLQAVAQALRDTARSFDHVVRYGGEEFALILPHTDASQAMAAAERLRQAVSSQPVPVNGHEVSLTASLGVATFPEDALNARELVSRADEALYEAKRVRNQVCSVTEKNRRFARSPLSVLARCNGQNSADAMLTVQNVSFGGMLCESATPLLPGTSAEISLDDEASGTTALQVGARVVRVEEAAEGGRYEIALSFNLASQAERRALVRLVEMERGREA